MIDERRGRGNDQCDHRLGQRRLLSGRVDHKPVTRSSSGGDGAAHELGLAVEVAVERGTRAAGLAGDVVERGLRQAEPGDAGEERIDGAVSRHRTVRIRGTVSSSSRTLIP